MPQAQLHVRATPFSVGGAVFVGIIAVLSALMWSAVMDPEPERVVQAGGAVLWVISILYFVDGLSERLTLDGTVISFQSLFQKRRRIDLCEAGDVELVHEGLNQEKGIISVILHGPKREERIPLGAFWRQTDLERFFVEAGRSSGVCSLVKSVR